MACSSSGAPPASSWTGDGGASEPADATSPVPSDAAAGDASTAAGDAATGALDAGPAPGAASDAGRCGFHDAGTWLQVSSSIEVCLPPVVCTSETCPPPLGKCVQGACELDPGYRGLQTLPEAWATYYCTLSTGGCHGVTQVDFPEVTAAKIAAATGYPLCENADAGAGECVGIAASSPMVVGNSQVATDPSTGKTVSAWGLGLTEASGLCYELRGPGGTALVALTDRCGGYCKCGGSGYQECGPCVSAPDMSPNCACVGTVPGLFGQCCGNGCATTQQDCDWCASNNHAHFDLDTGTFNRLCAAQATQGSCQLTSVRFVPCAGQAAWPPAGGGASCGANAFQCPGPSPHFAQVPGTGCCCDYDLSPQPDGSCK